MKKIIQMILVGIMIVPMILNAHDTKSIIGLMILIASSVILLPICFALAESVYSEFIKKLLKVPEKSYRVLKTQQDK